MVASDPARLFGLAAVVARLKLLHHCRDFRALRCPARNERTPIHASVGVASNQENQYIGVMIYLFPFLGFVFNKSDALADLSHETKPILFCEAAPNLPGVVGSRVQALRAKVLHRRHETRTSLARHTQHRTFFGAKRGGGSVILCHLGFGAYRER